MPEIKNTDAVRLLADMAVPGVCQGDEITVSPPSWRFDLQLSVDIVEEVVRTWGYEHIVETAPAAVETYRQCPPNLFHRRPHGGFLPLAGFMKLFLIPLSRPRGRKILARVLQFV